jgi:hypothetical protein
MTTEMTTPVKLELVRVKIKNARIFKGSDSNIYGFFKNRFGLWDLAIDNNIHRLTKAELMRPTDWPLMLINTKGIQPADPFLENVLKAYGIKHTLETPKKPIPTTVRALLMHCEHKNTTGLDGAVYSTNHPDYPQVAFILAPTYKYGMRAILLDDDGVTEKDPIICDIWDQWVMDVPVRYDAQTPIGEQLLKILDATGVE